MKVGSYRLFGLYPSEAQLAQIADLATSGLSPGKVGDRQTWLAAVRTVNPQFERYLCIRSCMRWSALRFDTEQHDMDGYTTALAKLNDTWFKRRFPGTGMPLGLSILQGVPSEKGPLFGIRTQPPLE
jgi:hypothetical protein